MHQSREFLHVSTPLCHEVSPLLAFLHFHGKICSWATTKTVALLCSHGRGGLKNTSIGSDSFRATGIVWQSMQCNCCALTPEANNSSRRSIMRSNCFGCTQTQIVCPQLRRRHCSALVFVVKW